MVHGRVDRLFRTLGPSPGTGGESDLSIKEKDLGERVKRHGALYWVVCCVDGYLASYL